MVLQFLENLPDRQAARNVCLRLDWKIAIGLELDDPGFHFSVGEGFRDRLEQNTKQRAAFTVLLEKLKELGLIRKSQKQRLDSTHVLGIEETISELCRGHGVRRARYRGKKRLRTQGIFSAFAVNVKRLTRAMQEGLCPDLAFS